MLLAVAEHENIHSQLIPGIATGFCSGIAHTGSLCGAVSGGIMAIGLKLGRSQPSDDIDPCYQAVRKYQSQFLSRFHSLTCPGLTSVDLGTPDGQAAFTANKQIEKCSSYVAEAAKMVVDLLDNIESKGK